MKQPWFLLGALLGVSMIIWRKQLGEFLPGPFSKTDEGQARDYLIGGIVVVVFSVATVFGVVG